ncbi:WD repeat-containing protein 18 [Orussus abietinus]|uniref:WD repeat-containing protein 18 n=1 Tax=Orussus abietinus TaxID=222816 RepID=UPI000626041D|nr:WD repeat-containing protein 18 [Orussus abietinus]
MKGAKEVVITSDNSGDASNATVWDPCTGSTLLTYRNGGSLGYHTLQILHDSYVIAADATKPRFHVWPLNSQNPVPNLRLTTPGRVTSLSCSPIGSYIVAAVSEKLFVWQFTSGRLLCTLARHYQTITCTSFTSDGSMFASGAEDGLVFVWSLARTISRRDCEPIHSFSDHILPIKDLCFSHFGPKARLVTISLDRTARIYDSNSGSLLLNLIFDVPLSSVVIDPLENDLFIGCSNGNIQHIDLRSPPRGTEYHVQLTATEKNSNSIFRGHEASVVTLSLSADRSTLLSGATDGVVNIWDIRSRQVTRSINLKGAVTSAFFTRATNNFQENDLKPKLQMRGLQRISDEIGGYNFVEIITSHDASERLLNIQSYVESNSGLDRSKDSDTQKLEEARAEVEKLKSINTAMYQYAAKCLLNKLTDPP